MSSTKQITYNFARFLELVLGVKDYIELPIQEAIIINEIDKDDTLCHIEFPDDLNTIDTPRLWEIRAWRTHIVKVERSKKQAAANRLEYENYKLNVASIAEAMSRLTNLPVSQCMDIAVGSLHNNPENMDELNRVLIAKSIKPIELVKPYYKGVYVVLPCRRED